LLKEYPMSTVMRRSPVGRPPRARAIPLALAGLLAGSVQFTPATQAANVDAKANGAAKPKPVLVAQPAPVITEVLVIDGGRVASQTTPEAARKDGLTVVDLSDDWLPFVFSETQEKPQPLRPFLQDLANGRMRASKSYARPREDRFFEAFGIFPSLNLVRRRLADKKRHACHDKVKDVVLEELAPKNVIPPEEPEKIPNPDPATVKETPMIQTGRTLPPRPLTPTETRAVIAMQAHLRCEDLLSGKASSGRMDRRTAEGLRTYQRLHMLADNSKIDVDTRTVLMGDSREHDFRMLLRVLRERVVDATGLLEDGSALGVAGQVQGRLLDSPEFLPLPVPADRTPAGASPTAQTHAPQGQAAPAPGQPAAPVVADASAKITAAPDLIAAATHAASQALGWTSPEAALASTLAAPAPPAGTKKPARKTAAKKGPAPLPTHVAVKLPPLPPYHGPKMELRAEIDRGDVVLARPQLDKDGKKKWKPPVADRPTLTLYARNGDKEVALSRWPTTIGGWKTIEKKDGTMALKYKESVTGDALWPEVLATPSWHPAPGMPTRKLLVKRGDTFEPKTEIIGPGYRAAYGLVAIVHHQIMERNDKGEPQLMDLRIRTHGTPAYRSVKRGESNGCHRLHNYLALRLSAFLVKHREHVRDGNVPEDYVRNLEYKGQKVALESESKGYRFKLTPPVQVTVLDGDVKGDAKAIKRLVPLAAVP
jgi:hypothetical protein